jgi:hypothetical protein
VVSRFKREIIFSRSVRTTLIRDIFLKTFLPKSKTTDLLGTDEGLDALAEFLKRTKAYTKTDE